MIYETEKKTVKLSDSERIIILENAIKENVTLNVVSNGRNSVEIESSKLKILERKIILLPEPSPEIRAFCGDDVDVNFSFNGISFNFNAKMKNVNMGVAFAVPEYINRVEKKMELKSFSFILFFETLENVKGLEFLNKRDVECFVRDEYFSARPLNEMRNITRYFSDPTKIEFDVPEIIFVNHERIVLAFKENMIEIEEGKEFAAWIKFPLKRPLNERKIYVAFVVDKIYRKKDSENGRFCASCKISSVKLEDIRFLLEYFT